MCGAMLSYDLSPTISPTASLLFSEKGYLDPAAEIPLKVVLEHATWSHPEPIHVADGILRANLRFTDEMSIILSSNDDVDVTKTGLQKEFVLESQLGADYLVFEMDSDFDVQYWHDDPSTKTVSTMNTPSTMVPNESIAANSRIAQSFSLPDNAMSLDKVECLVSSVEDFDENDSVFFTIYH